jgi:hypothetical protein
MTPGPEDQTPDKLREEQAEKARDERAHAEHATTEHDAVTHDRRSDKAAYLAAKLAERERSEQHADDEKKDR